MAIIKEIDKYCSLYAENEYLEPKKCFLPEEALNLIKLGLDASTSDIEFQGQPNWSVDRILELFPNITLEFGIKTTCYAYGDEGELIVKETGECPQDALYHVVCYMLKNYGNN